MIREKILKKLMQNPHGYVPAKEIAAELGVAVQAVDRQIKELQEMGCEIHAQGDEGYRLSSLSDLLFPELVEICRFDGGNARYTIHHYHEVDSTNRVARESALSGAPHGTIVVSEAQTAGRGRQGRSWVSAPYEGIYCSIVLRPQFLSGSGHLFSLMAGVAVARTISAQGMLANVGLKWPNDVLCGTRKICGILCEMEAEGERLEHIVVGIGINVRQKGFERELWGSATSLMMETGRMFSRPQILAAVLAEFFDLYDEVAASGSFAPVLEEYRDWCICIGKRIIAYRGRERIGGMCTGIGPEGALLLQAEDGTVFPLLAGDISIRGDEIYV